MRSQKIMDRINTSKAVLESQLELINKNTLVPLPPSPVFLPCL